MTKVSVDFESRSPVDLKGCGAFVYFEHPDTTVLMAAYRIDDQPVRIWTYDQPPPLDLHAAIIAGSEIHAFNAQFESLGFDLLADRHGWPRPRLDQFYDTAAAGAALALPRKLGDLAAALNLPVQKDKEGDRLIRLFSIPRKPKKDEPPGLYWNEPADYPEDFERFKSYCIRDVETEEAAAARMVPLSDAEQEQWVRVAHINRRGIRIDRRSAVAALRLAEKAKKLLDKDMHAVTGGYVTACSQPGKLVEWVVQQGVLLTSAAKAEISDLLEADDLPPAVRTALQLRQEAAKTSVSKLASMLNRCNSDGRVRGTIIYHGASTGRDADVGVNFKNMPRPRKVFDEVKPNRELLFQAIRSEDPELLRFLYPETTKPYAPEVAPFLLPNNDGTLGRPLHLISDALRSFILSAPGHDLVQADYSGIEGAVAAWLADELWKVEALHAIIADPSLPDMYRRTAAAILGTTTDVVTKKHPMRQAIGKTGELSLGFGGGVMAFVGMARNYSVRLRPLFEPIWAATDEDRREKAAKRYESVLKRGKEGTDILEREAWIACEIIKTGWRAANPQHQKAWHLLEDAVRDAIRNPGTQVKVLGSRVTYLVKNGFLWARLPSGRCLAYASPKLKDQVWAKLKLEDGTWGDPEVMDRDEAEKLEAIYKVLIQGPTSPRVTFLGLDKSGKHMVRQALYGGLIFENCLSGETEVLTPSGWRPMMYVTTSDKVWDGNAFVGHDGLICKGLQRTIDFGGVRLTPDHKVWTDAGWKPANSTSFDEAAAASSNTGSSRPSIWQADGDGVRRGGRQESPLARLMRVWRRQDLRRVGASKGQNEQLRMPAAGERSPGEKTRHVLPPDLSRFSRDARSLRVAVAQGLQELWRSWNHGLRALGALRELQPRHGAYVAEGPNARAVEQRSRLLTRELRVAGLPGPNAQQTRQPANRYSEGSHVAVRGSRVVGNQHNDPMLPPRRRLADVDAIHPAGLHKPGRLEPVYDLLNAGPLHRFTVRGAGGRPIIVSNCVQAIARDLLVNGMVKAEAAGYPIITTVYDEIVTEVPRGWGDLAAFERLICELPEWARIGPMSMPLTAGGFRAKRYRKD